MDSFSVGTPSSGEIRTRIHGQVQLLPSSGRARGAILQRLFPVDAHPAQGHSLHMPGEGWLPSSAGGTVTEGRRRQAPMSSVSTDEPLSALTGVSVSERIGSS